MAKRDLAAANLDDGPEGRARLEIEFEQPYLLGPLFGDYDRHLVMIEDRLGVHIAARGNRVMIEGEPEAAARAREAALAALTPEQRAMIETQAAAPGGMCRAVPTQSDAETAPED